MIHKLSQVEYQHCGFGDYWFDIHRNCARTCT